MVLLIIIPFLNGYFIGKFLPNIFRQTQRKIQVFFFWGNSGGWTLRTENSTWILWRSKRDPSAISS